MPAEQRALVTRPAGQADALIAKLDALGLESLHLPMLELVPIDPLPARERQRILDLDRYDHLLFISANAARFGLAAIDDYWPQYPAGQRCWAVGGSTAAVLRRAGLAVTTPETDLTSEGLLALPGLQSVAGERVLIVKGEGGRDALARELTRRGAQVDSLSCYRRQAPQISSQDCLAALERSPVGVILISSGEGLAHLSRLLQPHENTNLAGTAVIVPSARVAAQARDLGWRQLRTAVNASDDAMGDAVAAWLAENAAG